MLLKPLFPSPLHASILHLIPIPLHCSSTWVPMRTCHLICSSCPHVSLFSRSNWFSYPCVPITIYISHLLIRILSYHISYLSLSCTYPWPSNPRLTFPYNQYFFTFSLPVTALSPWDPCPFRMHANLCISQPLCPSCTFKTSPTSPSLLSLIFASSAIASRFRRRWSKMWRLQMGFRAKLHSWTGRWTP